MVLIDKSKSGVGIAQDVALGGLQHARNQLDQSCLAVAIFSQQNNSGLGGDSKLAILKQSSGSSAGVAKADIFELNNISIDFSASRNFEWSRK